MTHPNETHQAAAERLLVHAGSIEVLLAAQAHATLALVEAQREATAWAKEQVISMRQQQEQFLADLKEHFDEDSKEDAWPSR